MIRLYIISSPFLVPVVPAVLYIICSVFLYNISISIHLSAQYFYAKYTQYFYTLSAQYFLSPPSQPWRRRVKEEIAFLSCKNFQPTNLFPNPSYFIQTSNSNIQHLIQLKCIGFPSLSPTSGTPVSFLHRLDMIFQSSGIFRNITSETLICRFGCLGLALGR